MVKYPEDWKVVSVKELGDIVTGSTPPRSDRGNWGEDFAWISAQDFKGKYICDSVEKISERGKKLCRVLPADSVLITCIASIGLNAVTKIPCATNQQINALICKSVDPEYFYYSMCFEQKRFAALAGQTAVPIINKSQFGDFELPLPPLPEQKRIAAVLGNVDKLIDNLSRRVEKKRLVKQGVMQDLLTAKKRLPGFSGEWKRVKLGEVCAINPRQGDEIPDRFVYIDLESVAGGTLLAVNTIEKAMAPSRAQRRFMRGDILFQTVRPYQRNNLYVTFNADKYVASTGYAIIKEIQNKSDAAFVYQIIHTDAFVADVLDRCTGTSYPAINPGRLAEVGFDLPIDVTEQKAIAGVLGAMDGEIAKLEAKLEKYRSLKQGLMNDLLTGRVRV